MKSVFYARCTIADFAAHPERVCSGFPDRRRLLTAALQESESIELQQRIYAGQSFRYGRPKVRGAIQRVAGQIGSVARKLYLSVPGKAGERQPRLREMITDEETSAGVNISVSKPGRAAIT
jgi:hypothetical protein